MNKDLNEDLNEDYWIDTDLTPEDEIKFKDAGIQTVSYIGFVQSVLKSDAVLFSATGIHSVQLLEVLKSCYNKIYADSPFKRFLLSPQDRILLAMVKIKLGISFSALSILFELTIQTCSNYFFDTVVVLSKILKCMIFWTSKEEILKNMPKCFSSYRFTRTVLDCYEIPIQKKKCIICRVRSYSHYKKKFTAKVSMIVTPSGLICHTCAAFGGRASDKVVTNHSGIYKLCERGDGIMVDKGYDIDTECEDYFLRLVRPPFLKQKKQFTQAESVQCAKIARARVHVERVIQRVRQYSILENKLHSSILPFIDEIVIIVSGLVNLGKPVLNLDRF